MFLPYGHQSVNDDDIAAVSASLKQDMITRGLLVEAFEKAFAECVNAEYAVAFSSGSTALTASYQAGGINKGDRVLTSPNTFVATTAPASLKGADIVFIDIDRNSGNMDLEKLEPNLEFKSLNGKLFIVPVHFAGIAIDMPRLQAMATQNNILIIEDAAHALGSLYPDGKKVGCSAYSDMTIFSFHPVKTITTGEGGMVTTNNPALYQRLKLIRNSGIKRLDNEGPWYYEVQEFSSNFHMNEMQAALGLSQLKRLDSFVEKRRSLVERYRKKLEKKSHLRLFDPQFDKLTAYHLMVVQIDFTSLKTSRTHVMQKLKEKNIGSQVHYIPLYLHPCYRKIVGRIEEYFPEMGAYYQQALSLPLYYDMSFEDVDRVVNALTVG